MPRIHWLKQIKSHVEENLPDLTKRFESGTLGPNEPENLVRQAIPKSVPIKVTSIIPRRKDGGAFVKFSHPDGISPSDVETLLRNYLRENPIRPWWSPFRRLRTTLVRGRPWLEDLYRFPSSRLKVSSLLIIMFVYDYQTHVRLFNLLLIIESTLDDQAHFWLSSLLEIIELTSDWLVCFKLSS